jgi:hypothetical protein
MAGLISHPPRRITLRKPCRRRKIPAKIDWFSTSWPLLPVFEEGLDECRGLERLVSPAERGLMFEIV